MSLFKNLRFSLTPLLMSVMISVLPSLTANAQSLTNSYVPGEVIVKYKSPSEDHPDGKKVLSMSGQARIAKIHATVAAQKNLSVKRAWANMGTYHYKINSNEKVSQLINELKANSDVQFAESNYYITSAAIEEGQPMTAQEMGAYSAQAAAAQGPQAQSLYYAQTGSPVAIPEAWSVLTPGTPALVGVIDTGVDYTHPALQAAIWVNPGEIANNQIDDDHNGYVDDVHGWNFADGNSEVMDCNEHGTHVSGIVRGSTQNIIPDNNGNLPADINTTVRVKIMAVKFLDCDGVGTTSAAISAIYYAVENGAKILNNSWGGGSYSSSLVDAIYYAYEHNVLFVAAAGNSGYNMDTTSSYPASYNVPNVIPVAAVNSFDTLPYFSNYGSTTVPIAAPGVGIYSTVLNHGYNTLSGTSMASPFVAGVAALMAYEQPTMNGYQMRSILISSVDQPFTDSNGNGMKDPSESYTLNNQIINNGRLDAKSSVLAAQGASIEATQPSYDISAYDSRGPASAGGAGGCGLVQKVYDNYDNDQQDSDRNSSPMSVIITFMIFLVPVVTALVLRQNPKNLRRYDRFFLGSPVAIHIGQKEYLGNVGTIGLGGLSFNSLATLKLGHTLELSVASPSGSEKLNVNGQVVWMSNNNSYGVKFMNTAEETIVKINQWTQQLKKV